jgi:hypothetical protein
VDLRGPVKSLGWRELALFERRGVMNLSLGGSASPHACASLLLACAATLRAVTVDVPLNRQFEARLAELCDIMSRPAFEHLVSLQFRLGRPSSAEAQHEYWTASAAGGWETAEWPAAGEPLRQLLSARQLTALSLRNVFVPPGVLAELGARTGGSLRTLSLVPLTRAQTEALHTGGGLAGCSGLERLRTVWLVSPSLLLGALRASEAFRQRGVIMLDWAARAPWYDAWAWIQPLLARRHPELAALMHLQAAAAADAAEEDGAEVAPAPGELDAIFVALAQAAADVAAERARASEPEPPGRLEVWSLEAADVSAGAQALARSLFPGISITLPHDPPWPHPGECTAECSQQARGRGSFLATTDTHS